MLRMRMLRRGKKRVMLRNESAENENAAEDERP